MYRSRNELQCAKYRLIRWRYYERNMQELKAYAKINALTLFKSLKQLEPTEINWLAERYYKSTVETKFNEALGDYETIKPVAYKKVSENFGTAEDVARSELRRIERKLGLLIIDCSEEIEQERARQDLDSLERIMMNKVQDVGEREILATAFHQIEQLRIKPKRA